MMIEDIIRENNKIHEELSELYDRKKEIEKEYDLYHKKLEKAHNEYFWNGRHKPLPKFIDIPSQDEIFKDANANYRYGMAYIWEHTWWYHVKHPIMYIKNVLLAHK